MAREAIRLPDLDMDRPEDAKSGEGWSDLSPWDRAAAMIQADSFRFAAAGDGPRAREALETFVRLRRLAAREPGAGADLSERRVIVAARNRARDIGRLHPAQRAWTEDFIARLPKPPPAERSFERIAQHIARATSSVERLRVGLDEAGRNGFAGFTLSNGAKFYVRPATLPRFEPDLTRRAWRARALERVVEAADAYRAGDASPAIDAALLDDSYEGSLLRSIPYLIPGIDGVLRRR